MKTPKHVGRMLVISTRHMPSTKPDFGKLGATSYEYGYYVPVCWGSEDVSEHSYTFECVPNWMQAVAHYADLMRCTLVNFDGDAATLPFLPMWKW